jgi:hypothetical protein
MEENVKRIGSVATLLGLGALAVAALAPEVSISTFTVDQGQMSQGNGADMQAPDGNFLFVGGNNGPTVSLTFDATLPPASSDTAGNFGTFRLDSYTSAKATRVIELYNYKMNQWVRVSVATSPTGKSSASYHFKPANDFICEMANCVKARVTWTARNQLKYAAIDYVSWSFGD